MREELGKRSMIVSAACEPGSLTTTTGRSVPPFSST
jgi:hypothetical protein